MLWFWINCRYGKRRKTSCLSNFQGVVRSLHYRTCSENHANTALTKSGGSGAHRRAAQRAARGGRSVGEPRMKKPHPRDEGRSALLQRHTRVERAPNFPGKSGAAGGAGTARCRVAAIAPFPRQAPPHLVLEKVRRCATRGWRLHVRRSPLSPPLARRPPRRTPSARARARGSRS